MNDEQLEDDNQRWRAYVGPLGEIVHVGQYFFAWKEGCRIGRYDSLEQAMEALRARPCLHRSS